MSNRKINTQVTEVSTFLVSRLNGKSFKMRLSFIFLLFVIVFTFVWGYPLPENQVRKFGALGVNVYFVLQTFLQIQIVRQNAEAQTETQIRVGRQLECQGEKSCTGK